MAHCSCKKSVLDLTVNNMGNLFVQILTILVKKYFLLFGGRVREQEGMYLCLTLETKKKVSLSDSILRIISLCKVNEICLNWKTEVT